MKKIFLFSLVIVSLTACGQERRFPLGSNDMGEEIKRCLNLSSKKKYEQAVECLEVFKSRYPGSNRAAEADLLIGDNYFRKKEYLVAAESYQDFIKRYPYHEKLDYAYYRSGQAYAKSVSKSIDRDQQYLDLAEKNYEIVSRYYSTSPYHGIASEEYQGVRLKQARKSFYVGRFYFRYGEYLSSIPRFKTVVDEYTGLGLDEKSFFYMIRALLRIEQKQIAQRVYDEFQKRHPESKYLSAAKSKIGSGEPL